MTDRKFTSQTINLILISHLKKKNWNIRNIKLATNPQFRHFLPRQPCLPDRQVLYKGSTT